ncbi:helix-turn-helix domain-containing protein [Saccharopolyspora mangrovi]|uniref:Winged helix-turn-helix domain-containing protein n=1 Tax=Saccharopolyspora mangrovi TaxID=3082379 RepID=A0ABU6AF18_9PSEU|nr:helix-turn-helix domain-containing protein [Saccharopolyspora sp. S2-29]MEB3370115.1 winged helix-turn-helix domain-containing protein [Saccharopolyspora sp. S2-29]
MNAKDARKISAEALEDLRRRVVAAVDSGATQVEVSRVFGVARPTVNRWVRAFQDHGEESFRPRRRGRRAGMHRVLNAEVQTQITEHMTDCFPDAAGYSHPLWTRQAVGDLVERVHGVRLTLNTVSSYLRRWGLAQSELLPHATARDPRAVVRWRLCDQPVLARSAQVQDAAMYWLTWTNSRKVGVLSAFSSRRSMLFAVFSDPCSGQHVAEFLTRLADQSGRRLFVVIDSFEMEQAQSLRDWLDANQHRVSPFFPVPPAPELRIAGAFQG